MAIKDCIEHLYSWDYTIEDAYGCPGCVERERIIKLLEEHMQTKLTDNENGYHEDKCDLCANLSGLGVALAIIKGEQK